MCVYAKGSVGVREVGFRGKLPHHLFIQSTEDGVSCEREAAALGILEVKSCFSCYQHNPLSGTKKTQQINKLHHTGSAVHMACCNPRYVSLSGTQRLSVPFVGRLLWFEHVLFGGFGAEREETTVDGINQSLLH